MNIEIMQNVVFGIFARLSYFLANILLFYRLPPEQYGMYGLIWTTVNTIAAIGVHPVSHGYRRELITARWHPEHLSIFYYFSAFFIMLCGFIVYRFLAKPEAFVGEVWYLMPMAFCMGVVLIAPYSLAVKGSLLRANCGVFVVNFVFLFLIFVNPWGDSLSISVVTQLLGLSLLLGAFWVFCLDYRGHWKKEEGRESRGQFLQWIGASQRRNESALMVPLVFQGLLGMPVLLVAQIFIGNEYGYDALGKVFLIIQISNLVGIAAKRILHILTPRVLVDTGRARGRYYFNYYCVACLFLTLVTVSAFSVARFYSESLMPISVEVMSVFSAFSMINILSWYYADILNSAGGQAVVLRANIFWALTSVPLLFVFEPYVTSAALLYAFCFLATKIFVLFYLRKQSLINLQLVGEGVVGK